MYKKIYLTVICGIASILGFYSCHTTNSSLNNMVATMEVKEPIEGVCDNSKVYAMLPFQGNRQIEAKAPLTDEQIKNKLNQEVTFLKDKPDYEDKGMVSLIINCKGEMVLCKIDNETKSPDLDKEIVAVFSTLKKWTPGTLKGQPVDCVVLISFEIKNGKISL